MNRPTAPGTSPASPQFFSVLALLWLAGISIRLPLLVVPPIIPLVHDDLHMSETQVGLLIGMPLTMFAIAAVPGSLLIARLGVVSVAILGLSITALASAARAYVIDVWTLYAATALMGFGVAIMQPALPTLARAWAPARTWLATAVYTNGMLIGATAGSALTIPLMLPLVGGNWRHDLLAWAAPGFAVALLYAVAAPRPRTPASTAASAPRLWMPDWKNPLIWLLGLTLGANNASFFACNAFVPDYLTSVGRGAMIGSVLGWLNASQIVASFILLAMAEKIQRKPWPFIVFGPLTILGLIGIVTTDGVWVVLSAAVVGFALALTFIVIFGLPATLSPPDDVHRMAGGMLTISYTIAVIVPILCGAFWDITGVPWTAFIPLGVCGVALTIFGTLLTMQRTGD